MLAETFTKGNVRSTSTSTSQPSILAVVDEDLEDVQVHRCQNSGADRLIPPARVRIRSTRVGRLVGRREDGRREGGREASDCREDRIVAGEAFEESRAVPLAEQSMAGGR